jgi:hypothetical protein
MVYLSILITYLLSLFYDACRGSDYTALSENIKNEEE